MDPVWEHKFIIKAKYIFQLSIASFQQWAMFIYHQIFTIKQRLSFSLSSDWLYWIVFLQLPIKVVYTYVIAILMLF